MVHWLRSGSEAYLVQTPWLLDGSKPIRTILNLTRITTDGNAGSDVPGSGSTYETPVLLHFMKMAQTEPLSGLIALRVPWVISTHGQASSEALRGSQVHPRSEPTTCLTRIRSRMALSNNLNTHQLLGIMLT